MFRSVEIAKFVEEKGSVELDARRKIILSLYLRQRVVLRVHWLPPFVRDEWVRDLFANFGIKKC